MDLLCGEERSLPFHPQTTHIYMPGENMFLSDVFSIIAASITALLMSSGDLGM